MMPDPWTIPGYDAWIFHTPADDEPEPCECGVEDCTCREDAMWDRADYEYEKQKDREIDDG